VQETRQLAEFVSSMSFEDLPDPIVSRALDLIIDQIGVQIGCCTLPWARAVLDSVANRQGGEASIMRYGQRVTIGEAALVNGTFGHSFELDDVNPVGHGHAGAEIIPAALATAEARGRSGPEFISAVVAAYEARARIGWAVSPDLFRRGGPHYSTACGPFGAAAACGKLLGHDAVTLHHVLGVSGSFAGGLMEYDQSGGTVKRALAGIASMAGVTAALLANAGLTGPTAILEGHHGFLKVYGEEFRPELLTQDLGTRWLLDDALFKVYACCGFMHPAIDAARQLRAEHHIKADDIDHVTVSYPPSVAAHVGITDPQDVLQMQFSTPFSIAVALMRPTNSAMEYSDANLGDAALRTLASRIRVHAETSLNAYLVDRYPATVSITMRDGRRVEQTVMDPKGSPMNPLSGSELEAKFVDLTEPVLGGPGAMLLLKALRALPESADVHRLINLTKADAS
jgi:2-methylcitrate dehydratase PrpD